MKQAVAYIRASTAKQGRSGLGLDAQREAIARFAEAEGFEFAAEHAEVETGKGADALDRRPILKAALERGVVLGKHGRDVLAPRNRAAALRRAVDYRHVFTEKLAAGKSLRTIAAELNQEGVSAPKGGEWHLTTVKRIVDRL